MLIMAHGAPRATNLFKRDYTTGEEQVGEAVTGFHLRQFDRDAVLLARYG